MKKKKIKIGVVDTTFSRINMGAIALDEFAKNYPMKNFNKNFSALEFGNSNTKIKIVRKTVPGIKDLPVECKRLLENEKCDVVMALGMVGGATIDTQCAHEASLGVQMAKLLTKKPIIEVFVHENEAWNERDFYEICNNRIRKHAYNAVDIVIHPEKLIENAGKGIRQGREDEGQIELGKEEIIIGIVVSEFNREITERMGKRAINYAISKKIKIKKIVGVPGAYDVPLAAKKLLMDKEIAGVIALGAIVKGETMHDEVIASATAKTLQELALEFRKPVILGIIGPGATHEQAMARADEYAKRAVDAAIKMIDGLKE